MSIQVNGSRTANGQDSMQAPSRPPVSSSSSLSRIQDSMSDGSPRESKLSASRGNDTLSSAAEAASSRVRFSEESTSQSSRKRKLSDEDGEVVRTASGKGNSAPANSRATQGGKAAAEVDSDDDEEVRAPAKDVKPTATKDAEKTKASAKTAKTEKADEAAAADETAKTDEAAKTEKFKPYSIGTCLKNFFVKALWGGLVNMATSIFNFFAGVFKAACCFCKKEKMEDEVPPVDLKKEVEDFKVRAGSASAAKSVQFDLSKLPPAALEGMKEVVFKDKLEAAKADADDDKAVDEKEVRKAADKVFEAATEADFKLIMAAADKYIASLEPKKEEAAETQDKGDEKGAKAKTKAA